MSDRTVIVNGSEIETVDDELTLLFDRDEHENAWLAIDTNHVFEVNDD